MKGDIGGAGLGEHRDERIHRRCHQMAVKWGLNAALSESLHNEWSDGEVRDIVVVHDVNMDDIGTGAEDIPDLVPEP